MSEFKPTMYIDRFTTIDIGKLEFHCYKHTGLYVKGICNSVLIDIDNKLFQPAINGGKGLNKIDNLDDICWVDIEPDPHKEWVRIKDGYPMPNGKDMIIVFSKTMKQCYCEVDLIDDKYWLRVDGTNHYFRMSNCSHWRYPFSNPEV